MGEAALSLGLAAALVFVIGESGVHIVMMLQETRTVIPMSVMVLSHVKHSRETASLHGREVVGAGQAIFSFALVLGDCATPTTSVLLIISIHLICFLF